MKTAAEEMADFERRVREDIDRVTPGAEKRKNGRDKSAHNGGESAIRATPFAWVDPASIPPRQFLYGNHLIRQFLSTTIAHGGSGKSALEMPKPRR